TNVDAAIAYYTKLFGWQVEAAPMGDFTYNLIKNKGTSIGGSMPQPKNLAGLPSMWTAYFEVADADAIAKKAKQLGGQVMVSPTDIPNVGRFAVISDRDGAGFAVIRSTPQAAN
ncbi:MAG TPA: VOC family protein, partial [Polyangiaceae bacterium]|nr:VOC family protein [Polyangiaceae bacterium]